MGLFDQPVSEILRYIERKYASGRAREMPFTSVFPLSGSRQVILSEDTGMELGNPKTSSRSLLLWDTEGRIEDGRITLVGPDFPEAGSSSLPFAQVVLVGGNFKDEYDCYRDLRDAIYNIRLRGFMTRVLPGRQSIWCRISKEAMASRFSAQILGSALIQAIKGLDFVDRAEVLLVTSSREEVEELAAPADMVLDIVEALAKMYEEMNFDCESCEYVEVCDSVSELRRIRDRLQEKSHRATRRGDDREGDPA
jgi:acetyl-CoA decarbonylase/synthase complex subunit beta